MTERLYATHLCTTPFKTFTSKNPNCEADLSSLYAGKGEPLEQPGVRRVFVKKWLGLMVERFHPTIQRHSLKRLLKSVDLCGCPRYARAVRNYSREE